MNPRLETAVRTQRTRSPAVSTERELNFEHSEPALTVTDAE